MVDSEKNKAMIRAKIDVPLFGSVDANLLIDFTKGEALTQIPFLSVCTLDRFNESIEIVEEFHKINDKMSDLT